MDRDRDGDFIVRPAHIPDRKDAVVAHVKWSDTRRREAPFPVNFLHHILQIRNGSPINRI